MDLHCDKKIQYECVICHYLTSRKSQWERHLQTKKHKKQKYNQIQPKKFHCACGKIYKYRASLFNHKKKCDEPACNKKILLNIHDENIINDPNYLSDIEEKSGITPLSDKQIIAKLLEKNDKLIKTIQNMAPNIGNNNNNTNKFNLNLFLNERCKNAISLKDFVGSLNVQLQDLEYTMHNGIAEGITEVFVNGLKQLNMYERPIHCTDQKRSTMYIKDDNEWGKDNEHEKLKDSIISINRKHITAIKEWESKHPNWEKNDRMTAEYMKMIQTLTSNNSITENLIIKQVAKEVIIDRND
jgi:hypothetical protein